MLLRVRFLVVTIGLLGMVVVKAQPAIVVSTPSSSGGTTSTPGGITVSYTVGQPSLVGSFLQGNTRLLQGFEKIYWQVEANTLSGYGNKMRIFPNPAKNKINLSWLEGEMEEQWISVFDLNGRLVFTENTFREGRNSSFIMEDIPDGIYLVHVYGEKSKRSFNQLIIRK